MARRRNTKKLGPLGLQGFTLSLPIPFSKGLPRDYQTWNTDELKNFICFAYKCQSVNNKSLPQSSKNGGDEPPWWPREVTFDRFLNVKSSYLNAGGFKGINYLRNVLYQMYKYNNLLSILTVGSELAASLRSNKITVDKSNDLWKIADGRGRAVLMVDAETRNYDCAPNGRELRHRGSVEEKAKDSEEDDEWSEDSISPPPKSRGRVTRTSAAAGTQQQTPKATKSAPVRKMGGRTNVKRKLIDTDDEEEQKAFTCNYCGKKFMYTEFCNDHEAVCDRGPGANKNQYKDIQSFMGALGMIIPAAPATQNVAEQEEEPQAGPSRLAIRPVRKAQRKNRIQQMISKINLPVTSSRVMGLVKEHGAMAEYSYPPPYEMYCNPRLPASRYETKDRKIPNNMKKKIAAHADNPHIFSYGRRQRNIRYQEIGVGLSKDCWKDLNKCKQPELVLQKCKVPPPKQELTALQFEELISASRRVRVLVMDIKKYPTPEAEIYLNKAKPQGSEAPPGPKMNAKDKPLSSADASSTESLFEPTQVKIENGKMKRDKK